MGDFNDDIEGGLERALAKLTANFGVTKYVVTNKNGMLFLSLVSFFHSFV